MAASERAMRTAPPGTAERIAALRSRIWAERETSRALVMRIAPRLVRSAQLIALVRRLPTLLLRFSPVVLPLASMVFRRNRTLAWVVRGVGLVRLGRTIANNVLAHKHRFGRRSRPVTR